MPGAEGNGPVGWEPGHALGGHYGAVVDMCWGVDGSCLMTASTDQTCRITARNRGHWSELARPQVHVPVTQSFLLPSSVCCPEVCATFWHAQQQCHLFCGLLPFASVRHLETNNCSHRILLQTRTVAQSLVAKAERMYYTPWWCVYNSFPVINVPVSHGQIQNLRPSMYCGIV